MKKIAREVLSGLLVLGLILMGLAGCVDNTVESNGDDPPELPPDSSMTMDFSAFGGGKMAPATTAPGKNFQAAAGRVLILDVMVILTLAPPVALFKSAQTAVPVEQPDGSWDWNYEVQFLGQTYEADLIGELEGFKTVWSMNVTNLNRPIPLNYFEWYYGEAALNNMSGEWHFFDPATPDEQNEVAVIEWEIENNGDGQIKYTNTNERGVNVGDTLSYSVSGTTATIVFYNASENMVADIEWDLIDRHGSIKVPDYNGGNRAFWDENQQDM